MTQLKERRVLMGLSQFETALRAKVSQGRLSLAERGFITLNEDEKGRLAEVVGVPSQELFSPFGERAIYSRLRPFITMEEKSWLLDAGPNPDYYKKRLQHLAEKYNVKK